MNRLRDASARLATRLVDRVGDIATYTRDAGIVSAVSKTIAIVQGRERDITRDASRIEMFRQAGWDRDVLIGVGAFLATGWTEPMPGDRIAIAENGGTTTLEVFLPDGEKAWRFSDQTRTIMRIHCRQVN